MTPLQINLLLHVYSCRGPIENVDCDAQREAIELFEEDELIRGDPDPGNKHGWRLTLRGKALVDKLLSIRPPEPTWAFDVPPKGGGNG